MSPKDGTAIDLTVTSTSHTMSFDKMDDELVLIIASIDILKPYSHLLLLLSLIQVLLQKLHQLLHFFIFLYYLLL